MTRRVEDTEREKRNLVGVVDNLKQEEFERESQYTTRSSLTESSNILLSGEIQTLRANLKLARDEHQDLEAKVRTLQSTEHSTKVLLPHFFRRLYSTILNVSCSSKSNLSANN